MAIQGTPLRVVIADQAAEVRQALRLVCEESLGLNVVAEAAEDEDLFALVTAMQPDILLLEWEMPGREASTLMQKLRKRRKLSIIVMAARPEIRARAMRAGATGFVYKGDPPDELLNLLRQLVESLSH
ncbi:MAG: response regulator transcription factor [Anaerolineae bacterium]|nr:response regulator transcription factor [Anaerolineae bacterium]